MTESYTMHQVKMELRAARGIGNQDEVNYWTQLLEKLKKREEKK